METLLKELDRILEEKNRRIDLLEWQNKNLENACAGLKKRVAELETDVRMYQENEVRENG